jgi:hypothetical protein
MSARTGRVLLAAIAVSAFVVAGGGAAYAYWTATGSGAGSGLTGTASALTLSTGTAAAGLYPGSTVTVTVSATNPNTSPIVIPSLVLDTTQGAGGFAVDAGHSGCTLTALGFGTQTNGGVGWTVPAKAGSTNGSLAISLPGALSLSSSAVNACQGATFTAYLRAGS